MDYRKAFTQLINGSKSQARRGQKLTKEKAKWLKKHNKNKHDRVIAGKLDEAINGQLRLGAKLLQGTRNTMRSWRLRLFVLRFQNKELYKELRIVQTYLTEFDHIIVHHSRCLQRRDWKDEKRCHQEAMKFLPMIVKKEKQLRKLMKKQPLREQSYIMHGRLILVLIILLFGKNVNLAYDRKIFSAENRYNPLNPWFPLKG